MKLSKEREGEFFVFTQAILWGIFPVITILSFSKISPLMSFAGSAFFASIFFAIVLSVRHQWHQFLDRSARKDILLAVFIMGFLCYILTFIGLRYTTAGNASLISLTEVFFTFLFFNLLRREYISIGHIFGVVLVVLGAAIVLLPNITEFRMGDILILLTAVIAPIGNFFQRKARTKVSSEVIMFARSILVIPFIILLAFLLDPHLPSFGDFRGSLVFFVVNGFILLGLSKVFWIEGIHRISVTKADAFNSISPLLTIFFAWLILKNAPTIWQLSSFVPLFVGTLLLTKNANKK